MKARTLGLVGLFLVVVSSASVALAALPVSEDAPKAATTTYDVFDMFRLSPEQFVHALENP